MKNILIALMVLVSLGAHAGPGERIAAKKMYPSHHRGDDACTQTLKEHKVYTGNMVKSVRHQRYARFLFRQGKFLRAIHQSRRARQLAFMVITANKGTSEKGWELSKEENPDGAPSDAELEKELPADTESLSDEKLAGGDLKDIDIDEKE